MHRLLASWTEIIFLQMYIENLTNKFLAYVILGTWLDSPSRFKGGRIVRKRKN